MTLVCHLIPVDRLVSSAIDDRSRSVDRAGYRVTNTSDGNSAHGEVTRGYVRDVAAVSGRVIQADDVGHASLRDGVVQHHIRPASKSSLPDILDVRL